MKRESEVACLTEEGQRYLADILTYLRLKQMDEAEIRAAIEEVLAGLGLQAPTPKDKGPIMRELMPKVKGRADGGQVNRLVAEYLK